MVLTPVFNMLFLVVVARGVDVLTYGNFAYAVTLISILIGFSDLGLRDYFLSKDGLTKKYANSGSLFFISSVIFLILLFFQYLILVRDDSSLKILFGISSEAYALGVLHKVIYFKYQSENRLATFSKWDSLIRTCPIFVKIVIFFGIKDFVASLLAGSMTAIFLYAAWLLRIDTILWHNFKNCINNMCELCVNWKTWGLYTVSFLSFFLYFGADKLIVEKILGMEKLAVYSSAMSFMAMGQLVVGVLWSLYMPRLSRDENIWSYEKFMIVLGGLGLVTLLVYQIFSFCVYGFIFPVQYNEGVYVLATGSLYFLFRFPNVVLEMFYIVEGRYSKFVRMRVAFGLISLTLCCVLLPTVGIVGGAMALVVAEMLLMVGSFVERRREIC